MNKHLYDIHLVCKFCGKHRNEIEDKNLGCLERTEATEYYGHPMFNIISDELKELHSRKNKQYATKNNPLGNFYRCSKMVEKLINPKIENKALAYALILMSKQMDGVCEIVGEGKVDTVEEIEDKLKDMAVYSIISIILKKEGSKKSELVDGGEYCLG